MVKRVLVIGGGIIGLCTAYYLRKQGHEVVVVDQSNMDFGASYVNAGYLTPSHIIPLAAPGRMKQGLKWMMDPSSPLYIRPRLNRSFLKWVWAFNRSCSEENVKQSIGAIKNINLMSADLFSEIKTSEKFTFHLENKGLLMLCKTQEMLDEEIHVAKIASSEGLEVREISLSELKKMEPNVQMDVLGAVHYQCDWHTTPHEFMTEMYEWLQSNGVTFYKNEKVTDLKINNEVISEIITQDQSISADEFVLAAGTWSHLLSSKLGISIPLEAGKGYRINVTQNTAITMPAVLAEANVAVTPMNGFTRFAGTMEIGGINHKINKVRVDAIAQAAHQFYPGLTIGAEAKGSAACGLRPVSPDGRPYIGRSAKCKNLTIATGHAMQGWSMGPATGKLVAQLISEKKTTITLDPYHPDRKF